MPTVDLPIAMLLGGVFLIAGAAKLIRIERFRTSLEGYRTARPRRLVAWLVPMAEVAVGAALVAGLPAAGWAALALLAAFSLALGVEMAAGATPSSCGCLVPGAELSPRLSLIRNLALAAAAVAVAT